MTQQGPAGVAAALFICVCLTAATPVAGADGQRARARESAGDGSSEATTSARARSEDRQSRDSGRSDRGKDAAAGPVVVSPVVAAPTQVGGFTVGAPVVVGSTFVVGHGEAPREPERRGGGRHDRPDDGSTTTVFVPIYVPVETETVIVTQPAAPAATPAPQPALAPAPAAPEPLIPFTPLFVVEGLTAGVPVRLPPPSTWDQRNTSASVKETRGVLEGGGREYSKAIGGLSFDIEPADAAIFIDGTFVGSADDFSSDREPLLLRFGGYTIELRAAGYLTMRFQVSVPMGEVMPFRGTLSKLAP